MGPVTTKVPRERWKHAIWIAVTIALAAMLAVCGLINDALTVPGALERA